MSIKANKVDPNKAARGARGIFGSVGNESGEKNYFYTGQRDKETDAETSSSSSSDAGPVLPKKRAESYPAARSDRNLASSDVDSDEELLRQAQEATVKFLYPPSATEPAAPPTHNPRLEAYNRAKEEQKRASITQEESAAPPVEVVAQTHALSETPQPEENVVVADEKKAEPALLVEADAPPPLNMDGEGALEETSEDPLRNDFNRLLFLFAKDIEAERKENGERASRAESRLNKEKPPSGEGNSNHYSTYRPPARTFYDVQQEALHHIYERWLTEHDNDEGAVFIASHYASEAFTLATQMMLSSSSPAYRELTAAPFTIEELAAMSGPSNVSSEIARETQERFDRFMQSIHWIERLIRDNDFLTSLAEFFFTHHKVFFQHFDARTYGDALGQSHAAGEHSHKEFDVYSEFGARVSDVLWRLLSAKVKNFDEDEFAESLYSTPVSFVEDGEDDTETVTGPQNILSFPAWRLILSISDFESFFSWMIDYIAEEYNVNSATEKEVAVGGARGLRALIQSTYKDEKRPNNTIDPVDTADNNTPSPTDEQSEVAAKPVTDATAAPATGGLSVPSSLMDATPIRAQTPPEGSKFQSARLLPFRNKQTKPPHYVPEDPSVNQSISSLRDVDPASGGLDTVAAPSSAPPAKPLKQRKLGAGVAHHLPPLEESNSEPGAVKPKVTKPKGPSKPSLKTSKTAAASASKAPAKTAVGKGANRDSSPATDTARPRKTSSVFYSTLPASRRTSRASLSGPSATTPGRVDSAPPTMKSSDDRVKKPNTADGARKK